jgi:predicted O-methyltransferase YrrM
MLKTESQNWNKYLQPIADLKRPIKILEVGAYEGWATQQFLIHFAKNPDTRVYAIDTWEGSPEYVGTDFHEIEEKFRKRVKQSGREDQLVTLKMKSEDGLHHLLDSIGKESIDIAFIDASHEARDVLSDAILVWKLMKENGIVIFDDYIWMDLKQDFFRPRLAIDSFIRCYAPELRVLGIDRQAFVKKLDRSKWITPTLNYGDWKVVMKKVTSLSDAVFKLPELVVESISRRTTRRSSRIHDSTEILFTTTPPPYGIEDEMEYKINQLLPATTRIIFENTIIPNQPNTSVLGFSISSHVKQTDFLSDTFLKPSNVKTNRKYESDKTAWLEIIVEESYLDIIIKNYKNTFEASKTYMLPNLKKYDLVYIKKPDNTKVYAHAPFIKFETLKSLETQTYNSLRPDSYDLIGLTLITDATFSHKDFRDTLGYGRDSLSIKWNSLQLLMATHCLKKGGSLHLSFYGFQSDILCQFISYVSTLFSKNVLFQKVARHIVCIFQDYKGITKKQQDTFLNWYASLKPGTYYSSLGVPCKPIIQSSIQSLSNMYIRQLKKCIEIAKQYKELLDNLSPIKRETIQEYLIGLRVNNYFTTINKYIKENPL